jgi:predicted nucleic acid-binding protein
VTRWVIDASVALKWCLPAHSEMFVPQAVELLASYRRGDVQFLVPDLFWLELANALWKAVWKETLDHPGADTAYAKVTDLEIPTIPSYDLVPKALQLAVTYRRTVYDSLYVALAVQLKSELITADERLANALAARFPVKWLGAF